jgi:hypothetical protein
MTDFLIPTARPRVLLVIGTFAAVPYIHLQLESRRRFYPDVPTIIHDDCSPVAGPLRELAAEYGAEFYCTPRRLSHQPGDTHASLHAIRCAAERGVELAVKLSRSFVPLTNWVPQLQHTAYESQYATYSNWDDGYGLGFRTEAIAFHPPSWLSDPSVRARMEQVVQVGTRAYGGVEVFLHILAREVHARTQCGANRAYERLYPRDPGTNAYGFWHWVGTNRKRRQPTLLWHHADAALDYYRVSQIYGLPYRYEEFLDPNLGLGLGEPEP